MSQKELEKKIEKLEEEISSLKYKERLLAGRTALAWAGMASSSWRHSIENRVVTIKDQILLTRDKIQTNIDITDINRILDMVEQRYVSMI